MRGSPAFLVSCWRMLPFFRRSLSPPEILAPSSSVESPLTPTPSHNSKHTSSQRKKGVRFSHNTLFFLFLPPVLPLLLRSRAARWRAPSRRVVDACCNPSRARPADAFNGRREGLSRWAKKKTLSLSLELTPFFVPPPPPRNLLHHRRPASRRAARPRASSWPPRCASSPLFPLLFRLCPPLSTSRRAPALSPPRRTRRGASTVAIGETRVVAHRARAAPSATTSRKKKNSATPRRHRRAMGAPSSLVAAPLSLPSTQSPSSPLLTLSLAPPPPEPTNNHP